MRPSSRSTIRLSSVTEMLRAKVVRISVAKIFIPRSMQVFSVFHHEPVKLADLEAVESAAVLKPYGIKPEFGDFFVTFDMDMRRLIPVTSVKEEPIWPNP